MPIPLAGDILSRTRGPATHYVIAVNTLEVLDIAPGDLLRVVPIAQVADGSSVSLQRSNPDDRPAIVARARRSAAIQSPYNIASFNCEHLKNFVLSGKPYSETVRIVFGALVGLGVALRARGRGYLDGPLPSSRALVWVRHQV